MNTRINRLLTGLLVCLLLLAGLSAAPAEEGDFQIEGTLLLRYTGRGQEEVRVPDGVEAIADWAFEGRDMKRVILPEGLKEIRSYCFMRCVNLEEITLPASVTQLGDAQVFAGCTNLKAIKAAKDNPVFQSVDGVLFSKDGSILWYYPDGRAAETYEIPEGTIQAAYTSFGYDAQVERLVIPASLEEMDPMELAGIGRLREIVVAEGNRVFSSPKGTLCSKEGTTLYVYPTGAQKEEMTPEDFPEGIDTVFEGAMMHGQARKITLPDTVTRIENSFLFSPLLEEIVLPASVKETCCNSFMDDPKLEIIRMGNADAVPDTDSENSFVAGSPRAAVIAPAGGKAEAYCDHYHIPFIPADTPETEIAGKIARVREEARNAGILAVEQKEYSLDAEILSRDVYIPVGVQAPIWNLYQEREYVKTEPRQEYICNIYLPDGFEEETDTYRYNRGNSFTAKEAGDYPLVLRVSDPGGEHWHDFIITAHASPDTQESYVQGDAPPSLRTQRQHRENMEKKAEQLAEKAGDQHIVRTEDAVYTWSEDKEGRPVITGIAPLTAELTVPAELDGHAVTVIGENAMMYDQYVESLALSEGIREIGRNAFRACHSLAALRLPESVTSVGAFAFEDCYALKEITLPSGLALKDLGAGAFRDIGTETLKLADGTDLMAVSVEAFREKGVHDGGICLSTWEGSYEYVVREDGGAAVLDFTRGGSRDETYPVSVPETLGGHPVREIGEQAFKYLEFISSVTLPEGLEIIGDEAFDRCENLAEVTLPSTLKSIGKRAFFGVAAEGIRLPGEEIVLGPVWYAGREKQDSTGKWTYCLLADGTAVLSDFKYTSKMAFPAEVDGIPVTAVEQPKDRDGSEGVSRVTFPDSVTYIGERVCASMPKVTKITLPENLRAVGKLAFANTGVRELTIPEGVTEIGESAFCSNESLKKLTLPSTLRVLPREAFDNCKTLAEVRFAEGLEEIGEEAFENCAVKQLSLPASLRSIGRRAFTYNPFKELTIPAGVERIGEAAFLREDKEPLGKVTFACPDAALGKGLFGYDSGYDAWIREHQQEYLAGGHIDYDYQNSANWIDLYAEANTAEVPEIAVSCWPGSTADRLYRYHVEKNYLAWGEENVLTAPADRVLQAGLVTPASLVYELNIPEGVEEIADDAFADTRLSRVRLPSTLKKIGSGAFSGCIALEGIALPEGLTEIGEKAFGGCGLLSDVRLPEGLLGIGDFAFAQTALKKAEIPASVTKLGKGAFMGTKITAVTLPKGLTEIPDYLCAACTELKGVKIPEGVTRVGAEAFRYCQALSSAALPESLEEIGEGAFAMSEDQAALAYRLTRGKQKASSLKALKLPAGLRVIGDNAFDACDALTSVTFAKGSRLAEIGAQAFSMCVHLKEIALPDGVRGIGGRCFSNCVDLKKASLGASLERIGKEAFRNCVDLASLSVPDTLTEIGEGVLDKHGKKLKVTCGEGSALEQYLQEHYADVKIVHPKKK